MFMNSILKTSDHRMSGMVVDGIRGVGKGNNWMVAWNELARESMKMGERGREREWVRGVGERSKPTDSNRWKN